MSKCYKMKPRIHKKKQEKENQSLKDLVELGEACINILRPLLNVSSDCGVLRWSGKEFQIRGAARTDGPVSSCPKVGTGQMEEVGTRGYEWMRMSKGWVGLLGNQGCCYECSGG